MLPNTGITEKTTFSPYRPYVCWHGIRKKEALGPERFCGAGADKYRVIRVGNLALTRSIEVRVMWLCYKHVTAMENKGYSCCKVTEVTE